MHREWNTENRIQNTEWEAGKAGLPGSDGDLDHALKAQKALKTHLAEAFAECLEGTVRSVPGRRAWDSATQTAVQSVLCDSCRCDHRFGDWSAKFRYGAFSAGISRSNTSSSSLNIVDHEPFKEHRVCFDEKHL
jgi:hypothetical protein